MANGGKSGPKWAHATANKGGGGEEGGGGGERRAMEEGVSQEGRSSEAAQRNEHRLSHIERHSVVYVWALPGV